MQLVQQRLRVPAQHLPALSEGQQRERDVEGRQGGERPAQRVPHEIQLRAVRRAPAMGPWQRPWQRNG